MKTLEDKIKSKGYTLIGLAKAAGCDYYTIRRALDGVNFPQKRHLKGIADALGMTQKSVATELISRKLKLLEDLHEKRPTSEGT